MPSFALVTEGITDQVVIESILNGFYKKSADGVDVNPIQPLRDATDSHRQGNFAGWEQVIEFCTQHNQLEETLQFNDFLIIQIDTDQADHINFNAGLLDENNTPKTEENLINDVRDVLKKKLGDDFFSKYSEKIIFAISVHSLECWLLPIHGSHKESKQLTTCEIRLNRIANRVGFAYEKTYECYEFMSKDFLKIKNIEKCSANQISLSAFISSLPACQTEDD